MSRKLRPSLSRHLALLFAGLTIALLLLLITPNGEGLLAVPLEQPITTAPIPQQPNEYLSERPFMHPESWKYVYGAEESVKYRENSSYPVPRLVYEETPRWHQKKLDDWEVPYVLVARHIPEKDYLAVFTQGHNRYMLYLVGKPTQVNHRLACHIGNKTYPLVTTKDDMIQDMVLCDLKGSQGLDKPKIGDHVSVINSGGRRLLSFAT